MYAYYLVGDAFALFCGRFTVLMTLAKSTRLHAHTPTTPIPTSMGIYKVNTPCPGPLPRPPTAHLAKASRDIYIRHTQAGHAHKNAHLRERI